MQRVVPLAVMLVLAACNPVETWRDWTGVSRNDPDSETARNTQNLAAGEAADYPNLASVPPPPNRALTAAEREKLTQSLIADRTNAKYSDERLRAGFPAVSAPAPPPPPPAVPEVVKTPGSPDGATAGPSPPAPAATPAAASGETPAAPAAAPAQGFRKSGEPPEPAPMESSLEVPKVRSTPNPEQVQAAPPPPYPTPPPTAATAAPATARLQSPPAPAPLPATLGSAAYQPPPPPPVLAPPAGSGRTVQQAPVPTTRTPVAEIKFAADSTNLSEQDRQTIGKVVPLYQQNPGKIRIIGYAGAGSGAAEQLNSFRAALDRAQAIAAALTKAGIPSDKIAVEAAPSGSDSGENRAEVLLEHSVRPPETREGEANRIFNLWDDAAEIFSKPLLAEATVILMKSPLKIAVAGLGTVGAGTLQLLDRQADLLAQRAGRRMVVAAVSARDRRRDRGIDLSAVRWYEDAAAMAADPEIDVVVELIGGADGIAPKVVETALQHGKHVVTANKALMARHGTELAAQAEKKGVVLSFEASVAGGIPVIKTLREGLAGNRLARVYGILNGTSNYILTTMRETAHEFSEVLSEAQRLGYAEADPSFDIDGIDAAHKLAILASVGFGRPVDLDGVYAEGIRHISRLDIDFAEELGYRIKLLGIARLTEEGLEQRVHPCMVPRSTPIAAVEGVYNAVVAEGDFVGRVVLEGRGAGAHPTASAVAADLADIAAGRHVTPFGVPTANLRALPGVPIERHQGAYYIRLMVLDQPGVIADVAAALRDEQVSMESMIQRGRAPGEAVPVVLTTHVTVEAAMRRALEKIEALETVLEAPHMIRIEDF